MICPPLFWRSALVNFNEEPRYVVDDPGVVPKLWTSLEKVDNLVKCSFFAVLLLAGARPGDIKGLLWLDVDFERRTAYIANPKGGRAFELVPSTPMIDFMEQARFDDELVFVGMSCPNSYREPSMPLPAGKWRNVYQAVAKSLHVDDVHLKLLVNHKLTDVTHGYAGQRSILRRR